MSLSSRVSAIVNFHPTQLTSKTLQLMGFEAEEYREIYKNFTELDHLKALLKGIVLAAGEANSEGLTISWLEGGSDQVQVSENGWYIVGGKTFETFPTFESLAMRNSPQFCQKWKESLFAKLNELDGTEKLNSED
jgi:hypothetical protein